MKTLCLLLLFVVQFVDLTAQNMRKLNREGITAYEDSAYSDAELSFRKAYEADTTSLAAVYNIANTLYKQDKYNEAGKLFEELSSSVEEKKYLSEIHHNLGNSFLKKQEFDKSIEAYKNALRLAPGDDETRYNLAYAKAKLQQQQQQNQQDQKQEKDQQEQKKEKDQNEQKNEKKDQQDQQDQQQQDQEKNNQRQEQAEAMKSLSKEDMERLLQAIQQQEKKVQMKLEKEKAKAPKTATEKDW